ncbi:MAG: hypothetical protein C0594_02645 [Marinilabiliales bacterium]|nr:MAG: hypothetical protein C0594_02645 [Marinilabiliales bacterium]
MTNNYNFDELIEKLKVQVVEALDLEEIVPDDFGADTPLFIEGLGLDSIDALELIVLMEREYGIKIEDPKERRTALYSLRTMAEFIMHGKVNLESIPEEVRLRFADVADVEIAEDEENKNQASLNE